MQQVIIGSKYQIVIPKEVRKRVKGVRPGAKVTIASYNQNEITIKPVNQNWVDETYGKFKKELKGAAEEVEKMRNEWEERLQEFEKNTA